jgi:hypothetical protein
MMVRDHPAVEGMRRWTWGALIVAAGLAAVGWVAGPRLGETGRVNQALDDLQHRIDAAQVWTRDRPDLRLALRTLEARSNDRSRLLYEPGTEARVESLHRAISGGENMELVEMELQPPILGPVLQRWPVYLTVRGSRTAIPRLVDAIHRQRKVVVFSGMEVELESFYSEQVNARLRWVFSVAGEPPPVTGALLPPYLLPASTRELLQRAEHRDTAPWRDLQTKAKQLESLWDDLLDYEAMLRRQAHLRAIDEALVAIDDLSKERWRQLPVTLADLSTRLDRSPLGAVRLDFEGDGTPVWVELSSTP